MTLYAPGNHTLISKGDLIRPGKRGSVYCSGTPSGCVFGWQFRYPGLRASRSPRAVLLLAFSVHHRHARCTFACFQRAPSTRNMYSCTLSACNIDTQDVLLHAFSVHHRTAICTFACFQHVKMCRDTSLASRIRQGRIRSKCKDVPWNVSGAAYRR